MDSVDRARELGAEHGTGAAQEWLHTEPRRYPKGPDHLEWCERKPEPDDVDEDIFAGAEGEWLDGREDWSWGEILEHQMTYDDAFRAAHDATIREEVQS